MIVNPWPGLRHEDKPLISYLDWYNDRASWMRRVILSATRLQWLYLTSCRLIDTIKTVIVIRFISTVNIFFVSGLRVRAPTTVITT